VIVAADGEGDGVVGEELELAVDGLALAVLLLVDDWLLEDDCAVAGRDDEIA